MLPLTFEKTGFITPKSPKGDLGAVVFLKLAPFRRLGVLSRSHIFSLKAKCLKSLIQKINQ